METGPDAMEVISKNVFRFAMLILEAVMFALMAQWAINELNPMPNSVDARFEPVFALTFFLRSIGWHFYLPPLTGEVER